MMKPCKPAKEWEKYSQVPFILIVKQLLVEEVEKQAEAVVAIDVGLIIF